MNTDISYRMADKKSDKKSEAQEFDEAKFVEETEKGTKITIFSFLLGIAMSVVSRIIWQFVGYPPAFITGVFAIAILVALLRNRFEMKAMDWLSSGGVYVLTWISFWLLLTNPPFI
jgi:uncharacterized membrane protein AbrB (regulator of aidB expression)